MTDRAWHGWERFYGPREAKPRLHVGPIPGRKQIVLYEHTGSVVVPLAYFRDEEAAQRFMAVMDYIVLGEET